MALIGRTQILEADDRPTKEVAVPEWGGEVLVRGMNGQGRDAYFASMTVQRGKQQVQDVDNATAKLVARCIVDPDDRDKLAFTDQDVYALGLKSAVALDRVGSVAAELSGLDDEAMEQAKKGSETTPSEPSTTGPPPLSGPPSENSSAASAA